MSIPRKPTGAAPAAAKTEDNSAASNRPEFILKYIDGEKEGNDRFVTLTGLFRTTSKDGKLTYFAGKDKESGVKYLVMPNDKN